MLWTFPERPPARRARRWSPDRRRRSTRWPARPSPPRASSPTRRSGRPRRPASTRAAARSPTRRSTPATVPRTSAASRPRLAAALGRRRAPAPPARARRRRRGARARAAARAAPGRARGGGAGHRARGARPRAGHAARPRPPRGTRFGRLDPDRLARAVGAIATARPASGRAAAELLAALLGRHADAAGPPVCLHGDANPRNALLDGDRVSLIDLEDAGAGPAAADLGHVLAGLLCARVAGELTAAAEPALGARAAARLRRRRAAAAGGVARVAHGRVGARAPRADGGQPGARPRAGPARRLPGRGRGARAMRPALLFWCQHSVGLGHLARAHALCAALVERFRVVLVCGGALPDGIAAPPGVEVVALPALGVGPAGTFVSHRPPAHRRRRVDGPARADPGRLRRRAARRGAGRAVAVRAREASPASCCRCSRRRGATASRRSPACATSSSAAAPTRARTTRARARSPTRISTACSCTAIRASPGWSTRSRRTPTSRVPVRHTGFVVRGAARARRRAARRRRRLGRRRARRRAAAARGARRAARSCGRGPGGRCASSPGRSSRADERPSSPRRRGRARRHARRQRARPRRRARRAPPRR